jgi:hypothetical protein
MAAGGRQAGTGPGTWRAACADGAHLRIYGACAAHSLRESGLGPAAFQALCINACCALPEVRAHAERSGSGHARVCAARDAPDVLGPSERAGRTRDSLAASRSPVGRERAGQSCQCEVTRRRLAEQIVCVVLHLTVMLLATIMNVAILERSAQEDATDNLRDVRRCAGVPTPLGLTPWRAAGRGRAGRRRRSARGRAQADRPGLGGGSGRAGARGGRDDAVPARGGLAARVRPLVSPPRAPLLCRHPALARRLHAPRAHQAPALPRLRVGRRLL